MNIPEYHPDFRAEQAHEALKKCVEIQDHAQHCAVLWFADIYQRRLYRDLGYSSMNQYAAEGLGFSVSRTNDFIRLAKKLDALPAVREELAAGRLGYTKARAIVPVADPGNEKAWLEAAATQSRRQLEQTVRKAREVAKRDRQTDPNQGTLLPPRPATTPRAAVPVHVGFELTPSQFARYEKLQQQINPAGDPAELLLTMMESFADTTPEKCPRGHNSPTTQIHIHECPTCHEARIQTLRGEQVLSLAEQQAAHCDAIVHRPGQPNKAAIPPSIRRDVLTRDRHQCRRKGCEHTGHLQIHHLVPRRSGGSNDSDNLVTLCSACHRLWHEQGGDLAGLLTAADR